MMKMGGKEKAANIPIFEPFCIIFLLPIFSVLPQVSGLQYSIDDECQNNEHQEYIHTESYKCMV